MQSRRHKASSFSQGHDARGFALVAMVFALLLPSCHDGSSAGGTPVPFQPAEGGLLLSPSRNGVANRLQPRITWQPHPAATQYAIRLHEQTDAVRLVAETRVQEMSWMPSTPLVDGRTYFIELSGLDAQGRIVVVDASRFRVIASPEWLPHLHVLSDDKTRTFGGGKLLNLFDPFPAAQGARVACLAVVNRAGEYLWWYRDEQASELRNPQPSPNGNVLFLRRVQNPDFTVESNLIEMSWQGGELWRTPNDHLPHHEAAPGPLASYLTLCWCFKSFGAFTYEGDRIELIDPLTNQSLWSWSLFDHFDPVSYPTAYMDSVGRSFLGREWSHATGVAWDEQRSWIWLCVRNFDSILGIHYPTGEVRAVLGRLGVGGPDLISHPHAPSVLPGGSLLLFDNGNTRPNRHSRVVELVLNEDATTVSEGFVWEGEPRFFDASLGDADRLPNGNLLVTAGQSGRILELDRNGRIAWELQIDQSPRPRWAGHCVQLLPVPDSVRPFPDTPVQ